MSIHQPPSRGGRGESPRRPRLLFLCQTLPYPPDGGVWIRTYHVLRILSETFDVTALCFERTGLATAGHGVAESLAVLRRFGAVEAFPVPQTGNRLRFVWDHLRSTLLRRVYTRYVFDSAALRARLSELLAEEPFDLVHADSLDLSAYLPLVEGTPTVCVHHNIESALLRRRARVEGGGVQRLYYRMQADLMEKEERSWAGRLALNVVVSEADGHQLEALVPEANVIVVPNGVDVEEFRPGEASGAGLVYVGGANWFPNLDALDFFCDEILPHLRRAGAELPVEWVGAASEEQQRHYRDGFGVELTGYVPDVRPHMAAAAVHVCPLRAGGGTRLKVLNSWAMGKPLVSTSVGCEGLDAVDGENILIRDDPQAFAEAILELVGDEDLRRRLGAGGRRTAEQIYSWDVVGREMTDAYLALLG